MGTAIAVVLCVAFVVVGWIVMGLLWHEAGQDESDVWRDD